MAPTKMAPRRPQEGPKNNKKTKTKHVGPQEAPPPKYSHLFGHKLDPKLELSWAILIKKVFQNTLAKPIAFKHRFLKKFGLPGVSPDMKKQAKPLYCCSFSGFPPKWKKLLWRGVWGSILGAFWVPSWAMLATKLA